MSVTCGRSVVSPGYSSTNKADVPRYNCIIVESGVKHHNPSLCSYYFRCILCIRLIEGIKSRSYHMTVKSQALGVGGCSEFETTRGEVYLIQYYVMKFVTCGRSVVFSGYYYSGFTDRHDITDILLKWR
jgi:hypothetical protein